MRQDFDQGSAGRRDQFAFDIRRIPGNPGQEFGRRRCRDGHDAVSAADKAAAGMERRRGDLFDAQVFQAPDRTDDIQDTVDGADFMKVYLVDGDAMHLGFGFCQGLEYGQALGLDIVLDRCTFDDLGNFRKAPVLMVMMMIWRPRGLVRTSRSGVALRKGVAP